jgi:hypothetical protein
VLVDPDFWIKSIIMKSSLPNKLNQLVLILFAGITFFACKKDKQTVENPTPAQVVINTIQPKSAHAGDVVTITGTGFGMTVADVKVSIGRTAVTITSVTPTEIKFTMPAGLASGDLSLTVKDIAATNRDPDGAAITVTPVANAPTFTAMSPNSGKTGDVVTLTGTNFSTLASDNKVFFTTNTGGTVVLATIKTVTATTLTVEVPANVITGAVLITVNGTNAAPAAGFNTTFTVNTSTGSGTGTTTVDYITVVSGNIKFGKVATAANEVSAMYIDKVKNILYYSDYSLLNATAATKILKIDLSANANPAVLTTDARINSIIRIATDATGNVYALKYESGLNFSIYKISADGATITEISKNFELTGKYYFFVNANNEVCMKPNLRFAASGTKITTGPTLLGLQQADGGAFYAGNTIYLSQTTDNTAIAKNCKFIKYDLSTDTYADADFTLKSLFEQDDATQFSTSNNISKLKYALDGSENLYALMDHSYISGSTGNTWMLRKTKNGSGTSTALGSFKVKFPSIDLQDYNALEFASDAAGNLYFKANVKDIIKITQ